MIEVALNREERSRGDVATSIPDWIWETDSEGRYTYSNARVEDILGYRVDEIIGAHFLDVVDPREGTEISAILTDATRDKAPFSNVPKRARGKDGREVWLETSGTPLLSENGALAGYRGIDRDVTERQRQLERLQRAARLTMVGPVAHEINAARFTFGKPGQGSAEPINLNRIIGEALGSLTPPPSTLVVETRLATGLLPISGSSAQIGRVVVNLLTNAREAVADRGSIALKTENVYVDEPIGHYNRVEVGEYVRLDVSDTGPGISPDIRENIFDPFVTTKTARNPRPPRLGLSIVQAIVDDHDGYVDVESEPGQGTRFSVYFPVDRDVLREAHGEGMRGGTETILVVDDDVDQRELASRCLEALGYRVRVVVNGEEAVAYLSRREADLVILDMVTPPGIDGAEAYRRILHVRPDQRAIIVSGCAESDRTRAAQALGAGAYLRKPVTLGTLARAVRRELDRI